MNDRRTRKLIEVALPLEFINPEATRQKKKAPKGYPTSIHKWWAQRPLATCRAILFAQLVDDPASWPDRFPTEEDQRRERDRLHRVMEKIVPWQSPTLEHALNDARWEIARTIAWHRDEEPPPKGKPQAILKFLQEHGPAVCDPFSGGGSIPIEAQRLGLRTYGSDLNPVAALIAKALVEIPTQFAGQPPVNPERDTNRRWNNAQGLAEDIRYYGTWLQDKARRKVGKYYPKAVLPDGNTAEIVAYIWVRTITSPDPLAKGAHVPLASSFILSSKKNKKVWAEVVRDESAQDGWRFHVMSGALSTSKEKQLKTGTKTGRGSNFSCVLTGSPISDDYVKAQGRSGAVSYRLMSVVVDHNRSRIHLSPTDDQETAATRLSSPQVPEIQHPLPNDPRAIWVPPYGLDTYDKLFTPRQLIALTAFSDLIEDVRERVARDAKALDLPDDNRPLASGGSGANAYSDAIATYLAFVIDRMLAYGSTLSTWLPKDNAVRSVFNRQAIQMAWDFVEPNLFSKSSGSASTCVKVVSACVEAASCMAPALIRNESATDEISYVPMNTVFSTDPPYYDNVGYADLSDYFYVWLRRSLRSIWPELFRRILTPKSEELIATPYRHDGQSNAETFFLNGMQRALSNVDQAASPTYPVTIYYAFKQSEAAEEGLTSPGWATFLQAVFDAGFAIDGTWPVRSEGEVRMNSNAANALASSIVLVCTKRPHHAAMTTRREFVARLKRDMPEALQKIKEAGVGPVDMAQSALGPGMGIFTSYAKVLEPDDSEMSVRTAIALINEVREEILGEEDAHYDPETRFCLDWFQAFGVEEAKSGDAINMANAYNLGLADLEQAGVFSAKGGRAQLLPRSKLPEDWRPSTDRRLTHWECTQHLIRVLQSEEGGTVAAAALIADMSPEDAEAARALAYRLYDICERKGWAQDAQAYNLLAEEFPHLEQAALDIQPASGPPQGALDFGEAHS